LLGRAGQGQARQTIYLTGGRIEVQGKAGHGMAWRGPAWLGERFTKAARRIVVQGQARRGWAWHCMARRGKAGQTIYQ